MIGMPSTVATTLSGVAVWAESPGAASSNAAVATAASAAGRVILNIWAIMWLVRVAALEGPWERRSDARSCRWQGRLGRKRFEKDLNNPMFPVFGPSDGLLSWGAVLPIPMKGPCVLRKMAL